MKTYSNIISLIKNSRGIYCLDTSMGCESGMKTKDGCYNDCYAARSAKFYGYDFSQTIFRHFKSERHKREIVSQINKIRLDFVRIGCSGDPSENWDHTIDIIKTIQRANKEIVIITKHWTLLTDEQLRYFGTLNICINTSVSALDSTEQLKKGLVEYFRIKQYCKSILRVVSCNFNLENETGHRLFKIQADLFKNEDIIDTVFRPSKNNPLLLDRIIIVKKGMFNGKPQLMSKFSRKTFTGKCSNCHQMCGVKMENENYSYPDKKGIIKQLKLRIGQ